MIKSNTNIHQFLRILNKNYLILHYNSSFRMQTISGTNYNIHFGASGYEALASLLLPSQYSKIFILVDEQCKRMEKVIAKGT